MNILGISAGFHDAAISLIDHHGDILFAGHSERYSKVKNDSDICQELLSEIRDYQIDTIAYYERPLAKQLRQWYSGQGIEWNKLSAKSIVRDQCDPWLPNKPRQIKSFNHHLSHAAAGFQTSTFDRATVVVIDAIGEWDTVSIWGAEYVNGRAKYTKLWGQRYPHSIGLFYSAMTQRIGLKPNEDEYILMGMSAYGKRDLGDVISHHFVHDEVDILFKENLHTGIVADYLGYAQDTDIAAGTQELAETLIYNVMRRAREFNWSTNLVYMGGVALNCLANRNLGE